MAIHLSLQCSMHPPSDKIIKSFSCNPLPVPGCHTTRRKHEGWDTARLPKPRQRKSRGGGRVRTTDPPVRGSNLTSASRIHPSKLAQPGSILALVPPSGGMAVRQRDRLTGVRNRDLSVVVFLGFQPTFKYYSRMSSRWPKWLECEFTDRKVRGSNPTSVSRLPLSRLGQPRSIPALVQPSGGMAVRHRKCTTAGRFFSRREATD
ncbi:hypothetical protein CSKR_105147 [Clonorchis sinensis]|uniref:Uncharacterized protein n=1 Tax=Clonorchis sinensis TaxID=79923 RepID=A0A419PJV6_CLOSI|nr:hypothetical protein CSKR_105147 [Clonorchis sinensis]